MIFEFSYESVADFDRILEAKSARFEVQFRVSIITGGPIIQIFHALSDMTKCFENVSLTFDASLRNQSMRLTYAPVQCDIAESAVAYLQIEEAPNQWIQV